MFKVLSMISVLSIPIMITIILVHGYIKGINIYDAFVEGAQEGFKVSIKIMPYLIAIFIAIGILRGSGALEILTSLLRKPCEKVGIPAELLPLIIMKPISGSGSLAIVKDILTHNGPDSFIGRAASTMMGSSETIFYTMAVYFGAVGITKTRHTLSCAMIAHIAGVIATIYVCRIVF